MLFIFYRLIAHFHTNKKSKNHHNCFLLIAIGCQIIKQPRFATQAPKLSKIFPKKIAYDYIYQLVNFHDQIIYN